MDMSLDIRCTCLLDACNKLQIKNKAPDIKEDMSYARLINNGYLYLDSEFLISTF